MPRKQIYINGNSIIYLIVIIRCGFERHYLFVLIILCACFIRILYIIYIYIRNNLNIKLVYSYFFFCLFVFCTWILLLFLSFFFTWVFPRAGGQPVLNHSNLNKGFFLHLWILNGLLSIIYFFLTLCHYRAQ